jgi:thioredoxin 1
MSVDDPFRGKRGWTEVNEQNYRAEVIDSKKPVLVEFWGPKCKDCLEMAQAIQRLSERLAEKIKFCHFKCPSRYAVLELGIRNLPTFYFYERGRLVNSLSKENAKPEKIGQALEALLGGRP